MRPTPSTLIGGSQHPHAAPRTANQTDRHTRKPKQCTSTTEHTDSTPGPQNDNHATQEHTTVNRAPGCATSTPRDTTRAPRSYTLHCISQLCHSAALTPKIPSLPLHAHTLPSPENPNANNSTPPGQAAHLQSMRSSCSFAQGGARSNRRWQGHRHPETATPQTVPKDTEAQTASATCLTHHP